MSEPASGPRTTAAQVDDLRALLAELREEIDTLRADIRAGGEATQ